MKTNKAYSASLFFTILLFLLILIPNELKAQIETTKTDSTQKTRISEEKFVLINGIQQWITIKGESSKPIILFLHGGPGSPLSPYADKLYKDLEADFLVVQWDQRGTGKTYGKTAPEELTPEYLNENPLTLDLMINDGIELSEYLLKHLGKQKLILYGTSWGSVLGVKLASKRSDLFYVPVLCGSPT
jgi:pimeloyl-ACP methyl ester carboxylesterase